MAAEEFITGFLLVEYLGASHRVFWEDLRA